VSSEILFFVESSVFLVESVVLRPYIFIEGERGDVLAWNLKGKVGASFFFTLSVSFLVLFLHFLES